jgi:hypothetical protein
MRNLKIAVAAAALCASLSACSGLGALTPGIDALKAIQKSSAPAPSPSVPPPPPRVQVRPTGELDHGNAAHVKAVAGLSQVSIVDDAAGPPRVMPDVAFIVARRPSVFGPGYFEDKGQGNLYLRVPISYRSPLTGKLRPQNRAPVALRVLTSPGWRTRATWLSQRQRHRRGRRYHIGPGR